MKRLKLQYYQYFSTHLSDSFQIKLYSSGYFLWIGLPKHLNSHLIYQQLLEKNISVAPGTLFYQMEKEYHHIRINCSFEIDENIEKALHTLTQYLTELNANKLTQIEPI